MSPRPKEYQHEGRFEFDRNAFLARYIRWGMDRKAGEITRFSVQYEIEYFDGRHEAIVRFDDAHDGPHQHFPGRPMPSPRRKKLPGMERKQLVRHAISEIKEHYLKWERSADRSAFVHLGDPDE